MEKEKKELKPKGYLKENDPEIGIDSDRVVRSNIASPTLAMIFLSLC